MAVGAGAAASPRRLLRNLAVGAAALAGVRPAQDLVLPVQGLDQLAFLAALRTGALPRRPALAAMATSGVIIAAELAARRAQA